MSLNDDKRELLKLKQGLEEESETIKEEKPQEIKLTGLKWWENFFYHNKFFLLFGVFIIALTSFLVCDLLSKEAKDIRIILCGTTQETVGALFYHSKPLEMSAELFCPDFDENGNVHVETYYIDASKNNDAQYEMANQAKLYGEYSSAEAQIFIGDKGLFQDIIGEGKDEEIFVNLEERYPDCEAVSGIYLKLKGSQLAVAAGMEASCPDDLYICVRGLYEGMTTNAESMKRENAKALEVLDNIVSGTRINLPKSE